MKQLKRFLFRAVFVTEIVLFIFFYLFGANGLSAVRRLKEQNSELSKNIRYEQQSINQLSDELARWAHTGFYQEKIAREKLQMIKNGEVVYFYN